MQATGKELFGAAMRVVGLLSFGRGFVDLLHVLLFSLRMLDESVMKAYPTADLAYGLFYFFMGLYLVRGAPQVVRFAYPEARDNEDIGPLADEEQNPSATN